MGETMPPTRWEWAVPLELAAARLWLKSRLRYLRHTLDEMIPVERPGLGTLAVDKWWRLYYDPAVCSTWPVEKLVGVLFHESDHLARDHASRCEALMADPAEWNVSADAAINDDCPFELPGQPVTPDLLGLPRGLLEEEYYELLQQEKERRAQAQQPAPQQGQAANQNGAGEAEAGSAGQGDGNRAEEQRESAASDGAGESARANPSPTAQAAGSQEGAGGGASPSQPGAADGSQAGNGGGSMPSPASAQPSAASGRGGAPSTPPTAQVGDGHGGGAEGTGPSAGAQTPAPGRGRCGSCAHGQREPWELGPPEESGVPGVDPTRAEILRRKMAEEIRVLAASKDRGSIPASHLRWAEEKLRPRVDWRRELRSAVLSAVASVQEAADYTYRRPSRRQAAYGPVVQPSLHRPVPAVAVVVDTSGSVDDRMLSQALAEVAGVLRATGQREGVHVLSVDAAVQSCRRVFRPEQVKLAGGGGTDMRVGLEAAMKIHPRPEVIVVITDGYTPWPDEPPRGVRVVVALVGDGKSPAWAKTVKVEVR